jgi:hypothetical protein
VLIVLWLFAMVRKPLLLILGRLVLGQFSRSLCGVIDRLHLERCNRHTNRERQP